MNWVKGFALACCLVAPLGDIAATPAAAEDKPAAASASDATAPTAKKPTKAQIEAMLSKCSDEADAKGLFVKAGKGEARKTFRRECMKKLGVTPK